MVTMVGGQTVRGEIRFKMYAAQEPIHCLLTSQMSIQCSEQDSSDDPDEGNHINGDYDSVRPPNRGAGSTYPVGAQGSDASFTKTNRNSGSKRKSTDDSSEPSSKGKRYKERYRAKRAKQIRLADAGFELARVFEKNTIWKMTKSEQEDKCMERFDEWGIVGCYHDFCIACMKEDDGRRKWFLKKDKLVVIEWIERNIGLSMHVPNPTSNSSVPNQSYSQPNTAFNYPFINPNP